MKDYNIFTNIIFYTSKSKESDNFWHAPFNSNVTNNRVYLNIDDTNFSIDGSNNLILNNNFWQKDVSNNTDSTRSKLTRSRYAGTQ